MSSGLRRERWWLAGLLALGLVVAGCSSGKPADSRPAPEQAAGPRKGGIVRVALAAAPPTLDLMTSPTNVTRTIGVHIFESLVTFNDKYELIPQLAQNWEANGDSSAYTFHLRKGVKFHNGQEMTAADVKASLERFRKVSPRAGDLKDIKEIRTPDPYTVVIELSRPSGAFLGLLANPLPPVTIMPKSVTEAIGNGKAKNEQIIGTGPYKLAEWIADRHIKLVRFDDYVPEPTGEGTGLGGKRIAYLDEIDFLPVPEKATRLAGLETREYDYAESIPSTAFDRLKSDAKITPVVVKPSFWVLGVLNTTKPPFNNPKAREALLAGLNEDDIMLAAAERKELYRIDPGMYFAEQVWHSTAGGDLYNKHDVARAKALLQEAGYRDQEIVIMTNQDYDWMYKAAVALQAQLKDIGVKAKLQVYDWPTHSAKTRTAWNEYDISITGYSLRFDPSGFTVNFHSANKFQPYSSTEMDRLLESGIQEGDAKKRFQIYEDVQKLLYKDIPVVKFGDLFGLDARSNRIKGFVSWYSTPRFWNAWVEG